MTFDLTKLAAATALAFSLTLAPAMAQDYEEWDADASGGIGEEEWGAGFGENDEFGTWDENGDGMLDENEYESGVFSTYDEDESGDLNEDEFSAYEEEEDDWF